MPTSSTHKKLFYDQDLPGSSRLSQWTRAEFSASHELYAPSVTFDWHCHAEPRFVTILSGQTRELRGTEDVLFGGGGAFYLPPDVAHCALVGPGGSTAFTLALNGDEPPTLVGKTRVTSLTATPFSGLLFRLFRELGRSDIVSELSIQSIIAELTALPDQRCKGTAPVWIRRVADQLVDDSAKLPSLRALAKDAGVHFTHLARVFRHFHGCTIGEYARRVRLDLAAKQIARTSEPIASISVRFGFSDQSHFGRWFRKVYGVSPLQYRRTLGSR